MTVKSEEPIWRLDLRKGWEAVSGLIHRLIKWKISALLSIYYGKNAQPC